MKKEAIRVTTTIPVAPTTLYFAWLDSDHHSAMTGGAAKMTADVGAKYTAWNGYISGKVVTLDLGRRLIMSWRTSDFPRDAADSRVEIHLEALGPSTRVTILHTDIPEGQGEKYKAGWVDKYFTPMRNYFSKYLPDPRNPPPRRIPPPPPEDDEEEEEETPPAKGKKGVKVPPPAPSKGPGVKKIDEKQAPAAKVVAKKPAAPVKAPPVKAPPPKAAAKKPVAPAKASKPAPKPASKKAPPPKPVAKKGKPAKPTKPTKKK